MDLFDFPAPSVAVETSRDAAESVSDLDTLRRLTLTLFRLAGAKGMTDEELQEALDVPSNTARPRRWEAVKAGLVCDSGERRNTRSGRKAIVWRLS